MPLVFRVDGVDIGDQAVRLGAITAGFASRAEKGAIGTGGLPVDDPTGTLNLVGLKSFTVDETSSAGGTRLFTGYMQDRSLMRGGSSTASPSLITGPERLWDCNIVDLNAILAFRVFSQTSAKRPVETVTARIAWLMASSQMSLVTGPTTWIGTNAASCSACDYRGLFPIDVLNDIVHITGWDYYLFWNQPDVTLFLDDATAATRVSTLAISNALADQSSTVLYPLLDAVLLRDPSRVYSGVYETWAGGVVYQQRAQTATDFIARDVAISTDRIGKASTAIAVANQYLAAVSTEFDRISCTLKVPASQVNLIDAGMRINAKFTHLPGYETGKNMRIALRVPKADEATDQFYNVALELVTPIATNFAPFGNGITPELPPEPPPGSTEPACLTALGTIMVVSSSDGHYPTGRCTSYVAKIGSRLMCHDEGVGNPCYGGFGSTGTLFWGPSFDAQEQKTLSYSVPAGAVIVRATAHVTTDGGNYGTAGAHGWEVSVVDHVPSGWHDGSGFMASLAADTTVTADLPANIFDGSTVYFQSMPSWQEADKRICGVSTDPFPGGDYDSAGAIDTLTFMGFCDGAIGMANWVGGIGAVDGTNRTFSLISWDGTGVPQAKVNGLPTPIAVNSDGTVTFANAPAAGSLVTFNYSVSVPTNPAPPPPNPGSIQALLDAAAAGATVTLSTGTFSGQNVYIRKAGQTLDLNGSMVDGGSTQAIGIWLTADNTTLKNGTVTNFVNPLQTGAVQIQANGCTVTNVISTANGGVGIKANGVATARLSNVTIDSCTMTYNEQEGYNLSYVDTYTFTNNVVHHNNPNLAVDPGWEAGGGKVFRSTGGTVTGNGVHHNGGPGMWWDTCPAASTIVSGNSVHHDWVGIMVEVSGGFTVHDNAIWEEGWTNLENQGWGWPAGLLFSTTINCEAYSNTLGWNDVGISVLWQPNRVGNDAPASNPTANYTHHNLVAATDVTGSGGGLRMEGWYEDAGGTAMFTDHTNRGYQDRFYTTLVAGTSSDRYEYDGALSSIAAFQVTVGGNGATEVSSGTALAALTAAGIPTSPEHT